MTLSSEQSIKLNVRIPVSVKEKLDRAAEAEDRTVSQIVRYAIDGYLNPRRKSKR